MVTLYVFDITGIKIGEFTARFKTYAFQNALKFLKIDWQQFTFHDRTISTQKRQECIHKSYYITADANFRVDLSQNNHNPLRPSRLVFGQKYYHDLGGALLFDYKTDESGFQCKVSVNETKTKLWNEIFLQQNQCFNPYYET